MPGASAGACGAATPGERKHAPLGSNLGARFGKPAGHRVLRIERHTTSLPHDFFFSSAKEAVNYGFVSLDQRTYLLPAGTENATCMSGSGTCTRNVIEFHGYRPLTADAQARF